jgi:PadR family transcriptional regulator PadR
LATLEKGDTYGYALTQTLQQVLGVSESTLYPVLRRLMKEQCLKAYDQPWQGRNRRYYTITAQGRERSKVYKEEWKRYKSGLDGLLG